MYASLFDDTSSQIGCIRDRDDSGRMRIEWSAITVALHLSRSSWAKSLVYRCWAGGPFGGKALDLASTRARDDGSNRGLRGYASCVAGRLFVASRDGQSLPVLAFKLTFVIAKEDGRQGPEVIRGRGNLRIFYKPDGFSDTVLHYSGAFENTQEIELDHIEFYADPDSGSDRLCRHVRETTIATHAFEFGGRPWRTPSSRTGSDLLVGQYSDSFVGEIYVSSSTLQTQSPEETLVGLVGAPNRKVRY